MPKKIKLTKEQFTAVKDVLSDFVSEKDGDMIFEGQTSVEESGQQSALKKERDARKVAETALAKFGDLDPDEASEAVDAVKGGKLKTDTEVQAAIKAARKEGGDAKVKELQPTIDTLTGEVNRHKLTEPLRKHMADAGMRAERIDQALRLTDGRFKLDGDKVILLDEQGNETTGTPADFFAKDYKIEMPEFYTGNGGGGSGAHNENKGTGGGAKEYKMADWRTMPPEQQMAVTTEVRKGEATLTD